MWRTVPGKTAKFALQNYSFAICAMVTPSPPSLSLPDSKPVTNSDLASSSRIPEAFATYRLKNRSTAPESEMSPFFDHCVYSRKKGTIC